MQHTSSSVAPHDSARSICQPTFTAIAKGDRWEASCSCDWFVRGTREQCHVAADIHAGIIHAPIGRLPATDAQYRAAIIDNILHKAAICRARNSYQQRIRERGYQPPKGSRIAFIVGKEERADGLMALEPDPELLPTVAMFRQRA